MTAKIDKKTIQKSTIIKKTVITVIILLAYKSTVFD